MNFSNNEEAFVLASLKEFVKIWGSGSQAHFKLECGNGQAWVRLDCQLGHPASPHHPVIPPPQVRRHKGPARRKKDQERAAAHRASHLPAPLHEEVAAAANTSISSRTALTANDPVASTGPPPPSHTEQVVAEQPAASEPEAVPAPLPNPHQHEAEPANATLPTQQAEAVPAAAHPPPDQQPEVVPVHGVAVFENCPVDVLTEEYADSLKRFLTSEDHLSQNISGTEFYHQSSRSLRRGVFTHTVSVVIHVRTGRLWESPASYIRKHLGLPNNEWTRSNGTVVKLSRIHQK